MRLLYKFEKLLKVYKYEKRNFCNLSVNHKQSDFC